MGRAARPKPARLAEKLKEIREKLGLSQGELVIRLKLQNTSVHRGSISDYELDAREPPLPVLLKYARLANVIVDALIDDEMELPKELPYAGKKRSL